jgi:hypothetical protein
VSSQTVAWNGDGPTVLEFRSLILCPQFVKDLCDVWYVQGTAQWLSTKDNWKTDEPSYPDSPSHLPHSIFIVHKKLPNGAKDSNNATTIATAPEINFSGMPGHATPWRNVLRSHTYAGKALTSRPVVRAPSAVHQSLITSTTLFLVGSYSAQPWSEKG